MPGLLWIVGGFIIWVLASDHYRNKKKRKQ